MSALVFSRRCLIKVILLLVLLKSGVATEAQSVEQYGSEFVPRVAVRELCRPVLVERVDNEIFDIGLHCEGGERLEALQLTFGSVTDMSKIAAVRLYYGGMESALRHDKDYYAAVEYISAHNMNNTLRANPSLSVLQQEVVAPKREVTFSSDVQLAKGVHYFWISIQLAPSALPTDSFALALTQVQLSGSVPMRPEYDQVDRHRVGVGVRHAGDAGVAAYRIPGLVTANDGTLCAVYDIRHNSSRDLQADIEVGLSRSLDGGRTWLPMQVVMSKGETGGLPRAQNGVGDPAILVDEHTGTLWIAAVWAHGMGSQMAWHASQPGLTPDATAQLLVARSDDNGCTWSAPINLTQQLKDSSWYFFFQGPGRGITMDDGTLVFAAQYIDSLRVPSACILYSSDHGTTWHVSAPARPNTTESQCAEITSGTLMLNMRDNRGGSRAVYTTTDMGSTWQEHPSNRSALIEPVCMASLLHVKAEDNVLGRDLLLFSNPHSDKERRDMTLQVSLDGGCTWSYQLLLDDGYSWGYSCLTMIDHATVGILYESSAAHLVFQAIPLRDVVR